jgi:hypothetical protein
MGAVPSHTRPAFNLARVGLSLFPSHSAACVGSMPIATLTSLSVADTNRASLPSGITNPKSVESSQTAFASNGTPLAFTPGNGAVVPTGLGIDAGNACNAAGLLNNTTKIPRCGRESCTRSGLGSLRSGRHPAPHPLVGTRRPTSVGASVARCFCRRERALWERGRVAMAIRLLKRRLF